MEGKKLAIAVAVLAVAFVLVMAMAASGGGDKEKETPEAPDAPEEKVDSIRLDRYSAFIQAYEPIELRATTVPAGADVRWSSSDESVATVDEGKVQFKKWGPCVITAEAGGCRAECLIIADDSNHRYALDETDETAARIEGNRILRAYPTTGGNIADALTFYGYEESVVKKAVPKCMGDGLYYAEETAKRLNARGGYDKNAIAAEMTAEGWPEDAIKVALDVLRNAG